ncbi:hypothetical protein K466DRAFT_543933 [Polyporus arcularius HHB13444]|uniref:Nephrocystin 3-like N-terminal domain-containing protein n=1 Tax=Polyporus arcularius HHB13444 TaxID=1314778 RepID=A0A5C3PVK7_9APHY|nr:hypothetical protein K466DRAFT_543933 [Polyporus arcularius HHB13444]
MLGSLGHVPAIWARRAVHVKSTRRRRLATDVLNNTIWALENSKDLLTLTSIPGISIAVDVLLGVLRRVTRARSNADAVDALCREISKLITVIEDVRGQVETRLNRHKNGSKEQHDLMHSLARSSELRSRMEGLIRDLEELLAMAEPLGEGNLLVRVWRSRRDEESIGSIKEGMTNAVLRFQSAGQVSIQDLVIGALDRMEHVHEELRAEAERQQAYRDEQTMRALPSTDWAGFRSTSNVEKRIYLPGTREAVFKRLTEWAASDKPVCFLIGPAGMGKSTIASEFCRRHEEELGASFFFRRGDPTLGSTSQFFPTIADQLAQSHRELRPHIARAARQHLQNGRSQQMRYVVRDLIGEPLRILAANGRTPRIFVIVDGLDECNESASQPELVSECLRLLISCAIQYSAFLRLLITSRPDHTHIEDELLRDSPLNNMSTLLYLYDIEDREAVDRDITELIRTRICSTPIGQEWYSQDPSVVAKLTRRSQGLFAYARTAADFVSRSAGAAQMDHRLELLLTEGNRFGLGDLDQLYDMVLETSFPPPDVDPDTGEQLRLILAWIALCQDPDGISPREFEAIAGISVSISIPIINKLRSVVVFKRQETGDGVTTDELALSKFSSIHVTFRDYLVDRKRCGSGYHVDAEVMHARLATDCLNKMHRCLRVPGDNDDYAMWYWDAHVAQARPTPELVDLLREIFLTASDVQVRSNFFSNSHWCVRSPEVVQRLVLWVEAKIDRTLARAVQGCSIAAQPAEPTK